MKPLYIYPSSNHLENSEHILILAKLWTTQPNHPCAKVHILPCAERKEVTAVTGLPLLYLPRMPDFLQTISCFHKPDLPK